MLQFDPKNHLYLLDGQPITGVTTILKVINKPALIGWSANQAVDYIQDKLPTWLQVSPINTEEIEKIFNEARKAHTMKKKKAGDIGTKVHKHIENHIKGEPVEIKNKKEQKMFDKFVEWTTENKVKFLQAERQVYSEKHFFAGTYDLLCEIDGKTWLGDIKTSSNIYPEMFLQTAAYQICEEEMNDIKIDGTIVLNISKTGKLQEKRSISNKQNKEAFLAALTLYRQLQSLENKTL